MSYSDIADFDDEQIWLAGVKQQHMTIFDAWAILDDIYRHLAFIYWEITSCQCFPIYIICLYLSVFIEKYLPVFIDLPVFMNTYLFAVIW